MSRIIDTARQAEPQQYDLSDQTEIVVGRDTYCDIVIASDTVSRRHATISSANGRLTVRDLGSSNGTRLDGQTVSQADWGTNQILEIGPARFALEQSLDEQATIVSRRPSLDSQTKDDSAVQAGETANQRSLKGGFLRRHWRGEYGLLRSFLVNVVLISGIFVLGLANGMSAVAPSLSAQPLIASLVVFGAIALAICIWQIVGLVRSLLKAKQRGLSGGARALGWTLIIWPIAAAALAGLLLLGVWVRYGDPAHARDGSSYRLTQRDNVLVFQGDVIWPMVQDFRTRLQADPQINTLVLHSGGGDVIAARRVNDLLRTRTMTTVVPEACHSACTIMFAAGQRRFASPNARIGFHATSIILMDEMMTRIMNALTLRNDRQNANYYLAAGFDPQFVERAVATPSTELLTLPVSELQRLRVVTDILRPQS